MVGRAAAILARHRGLALVALAAAIGLYTAYGDALPDASTWWDVAFLALVILPAVFALIWLALRWRNSRWLLPSAAALGLIALLFHLAGLETLFDLAKLAALTAAGFWFLTVFEELSWVVLVSLIIPWVDAFSVKAGPTEYVVEEQPGFFEKIAYAFRIPGEEAFAHLGPPDVLFFALFLATADRFGLRTGWTWVGMTAGLGLTLVIAVWGDFSGLPALPGISLGFLLPNIDVLVGRARAARRARA